MKTEHVRPAEVGDQVKVLTPDEFLIPMTVVDVKNDEGVILLGNPKIYANLRKPMKVGDSVIISAVANFGKAKLRANDKVVVITSKGVQFPMVVNFLTDEVLVLAPRQGAKMGFLNKIKFVLSA